MEESNAPKKEREYTLGQRIWWPILGFLFEMCLTLLEPKEAAKFFGSLLALVVLLVLLFRQLRFEPPMTEQVAERIQSMENSIVGLRKAEELLTTMKDDLEKANIARREMEKEIERTSKLKKLSDEELDAIASVVNRKSWHDYALGLATGVVTWLVTSFLKTVWKKFRRKRLALA